MLYDIGDKVVDPDTKDTYKIVDTDPTGYYRLENTYTGAFHWLPCHIVDNDFDAKTSESSYYSTWHCDHKFVNMGFNSIKMVCKKCDKESTKDYKWKD